MIVTNQTSQDYWFGPLHLGAGVGTTLTVDDTTATSLYLSSDAVADALNNLYLSGNISVSGAAVPFPRPTGVPQLLHGDGSPEGLLFAPPGSLYMRRDNSGAPSALYAKTSGVTFDTGWQAVGGPAGVLSVLFDSTLTGSQGSFDISNISQLYSHLRLELLLRSDAASAFTTVLVRLNNDSSGNYDYDANYLSAGSVGAIASGTAATSATLGRATAGSATANYVSKLTLTIPSYVETNFYKVIEGRGANIGGSGAGNHAQQDASATWKSTAAVNRVTVLPAAGNWIAGSRATLYGLS